MGPLSWLLEAAWGQVFNTLRPRQNDCHILKDIFKCIFLNENKRISIKSSLKFVPKGPINNIPSLVLIMAWCRSGNKPLSEPMMVSLLMHICVTPPQLVNMTLGVPWYLIQSCWPLLTHWGWDKMANMSADDIFICIFLAENVWILLKISLKFVPNVRINNVPALAQIMAWRHPGDRPLFEPMWRPGYRPLFEPMMVILPTHICITRPQWGQLWCHMLT